jgi:mono/diheme cytochrome c family protein
VRHPAVIAAAAALGAAALAGCGSQGVASPTPNTVVGTVSTTPSFPIVAAFHLKGAANKGSAVYSSASCGGCHTLAAAHSTGTVGPNLDQAKPSFDLVVHRVTLGQGGMPSFKDQLQPQQIADVAEFVSSSAGG